ncbi:integral membrane protein PTH11 [Fusarium sp. NRRL 52700]|nr:integral membrane protein PTH11 [Fusarium sp. NRRL 52700]
MVKVSEAWHAVKPTGLAVDLLAVTIIFTPMVIVLVGLRTWVRVTHHCFGLEDWLMCIGATLNLVHDGVVIWGSFTGIGTLESKLNTAGDGRLQSREILADLLYQQLYVHQDIHLRSALTRHG